MLQIFKVPKGGGDREMSPPLGVWCSLPEDLIPVPRAHVGRRPAALPAQQLCLQLSGLQASAVNCVHHTQIHSQK